MLVCLRVFLDPEDDLMVHSWLLQESYDLLLMAASGDLPFWTGKVITLPYRILSSFLHLIVYSYICLFLGVRS